MIDDAKSFFRRFQSGLDVAVAAAPSQPEKVLGIRDGFRRFMHDALDRELPLTLTTLRLDGAELPMSSGETLELARERAVFAGEASRRAAFAVGCEGGLSAETVGGDTRYFVLNWTVIRGLDDEAWGSSGALQLPQHLIDGRGGAEIPLSIPGTRRGGGMASSLTGGAETVRTAAKLATYHALCSLLYGRLGVQSKV
ncbi:MAG: DUF84 family protein [Acidobacteriota bacterium]